MRLLISLLLSAELLGASPRPADATNIFALLDTGEFYRSANNGSAWSAIGAIPVIDAVGLAAGSSSSELYLASRSGTVFRSINGGTSWGAVGAVTASDVRGFTLTPTGKVLVLTASGTVYASSDQGATFTAIAGLVGSDWVGLARGPLGRIDALTKTGQVAESRDEGTTWATVGVVTTSDAVAIRRLGAQLFVLASTGEVYRSLNYGASWIAVSALSQGSMSALVDLGGQLVASTREGEVASSANGASWAWVGAINQLNVVALGTDTPQVTGVEGEESLPRFSVAAPYPNPRVGAGEATFGFTLPAADLIQLELFDVRGRLVASRPFEAIPAAGSRSIRWEPPPLASGTYLVRFRTASGRSAATKLTVTR